jgi:DNA-binding transcriptional MerR regulator
LYSLPGADLDTRTSNCYVLGVVREDEAFDLAELCERAGVTPRTVRYYIQQGLLPSPEPQGPATRYGRPHLDRLRVIRQLQRQHLPLAAIRANLERLGDEDLRALSEATSSPAKRSSAIDYVRSVLAAPDPRAVAERVRRASLPALRPASAAAPSAPTRAQWERISLTPDVELHVRRPLTREENRRVERLLDLARQILEEEE